MRTEIKYLEVAKTKSLIITDIPPLALSVGIKGDRALKLAAMLDCHGKDVRNNIEKLTPAGYMEIAKTLLISGGAHNCGYASGLANVGNCTPTQAQQVIDDIESYLIAESAE